MSGKQLNGSTFYSCKTVCPGGIMVTSVHVGDVVPGCAGGRWGTLGE